MAHINGIIRYSHKKGVKTTLALGGAAVYTETLNPKHEKIIIMLYTIAVVLLILWLLGLVSAYTIGGFIHILPVLAIVVVLLRIIGGQKPV